MIDDGEQSRESFVLYMRHRLTGLGGEGTRVMHADLDDYPQYRREFQGRVTSADRVSNRTHLPKAVGAVTYADRKPIAARRQHARNEAADAVHDAHQIDVERPAPVF